MKIPIRTFFIMPVLAALSGCVAVPVDAVHYQPAPVVYVPPPVVYGPRVHYRYPAYYGPSVRFGVYGGRRWR